MLNNINTLEDVAEQLHKFLGEVNLYTMPYNYCSGYSSCNNCPFGEVVYTYMDIDTRICEVLYQLEYKLDKIVKPNQT